MPENTTLFRLALSLAGGSITALLAVIAGAAWGLALGLDVLACMAVLGAAGFLWGAISFQLTPTGGVIMDNRVTVNYAVIATYGWIAGFACIAALVAYLARVAI